MAIITISRGSLSGGRALAACLARHLGYPAVAAEILQGAARRLGVSLEDVRGGFETAPGLWARVSREREKYVSAVRATLAEACIGGRLVYHGLAGQFLLQGLAGVLRVRLIAPLEMRVQTLTDEPHRMTPRAAAEFIRAVDHNRRRRVKLMYGADVEDPDLYDLTVNLRSLSLDTACVAIQEAAAQPPYVVTAQVASELEAFATRSREQLQAVTASP